MAKVAAAAVLANAIGPFIEGATSTIVGIIDKIAFDSDIIGRKRQILWMNEQTRCEFEKNGQKVNIAIWNMHVDIDHHFDGILTTGLQKMGGGGGFRIVVFTGSGYLKNNGSRGFENWCGSGNHIQKDNLIEFYPV